MALDPHVRRLLDMVAASRPAGTPAPTIDERRRGFAKLMALSGLGAAAGRAEDRILPGPNGPIPVRVYTSARAANRYLPGLVYFHGGGFVAGGLDTNDALARTLADECGARVVAVDYRLAPEHRFPAALVDCHAATVWAMVHPTELGIEPGMVAVAGDSAGASLAAVVCRRLGGPAGPQPLFQLLLCPIADFAAETESRRLFGTGHLIDEAMIAADLRHYLPPGTAATDPQVSPLRAADLSGLCPAYIHTAEADPLRDEATDYAVRLREAGVAAQCTCHAGMIHLFYGMAGVIPYARIAWAQIGAEIRAAFAEAAVPASRARAG
jgi:acetyl esterase/lipase